MFIFSGRLYGFDRTWFYRPKGRGIRPKEIKFSPLILGPGCRPSLMLLIYEGILTVTLLPSADVLESTF